jgi:hypothetical protein
LILFLPCKVFPTLAQIPIRLKSLEKSQPE